MAEILLFVPTYNECDNAPRMARELAALPLDADILFVDDNSPDGTGKLLEDIKKEIPRIPSCKIWTTSGKIKPYIKIDFNLQEQ